MYQNLLYSNDSPIFISTRNLSFMSKTILTSFLACLLILSIQAVSAQVKFQKFERAAKRSAHIPQYNGVDYQPLFQLVEVADEFSHTNSDLAEAKRRSALRFPRKEGTKNQIRGPVAEPIVRFVFDGIKAALGVPLDNDMAISRDGKIVNAVNNHIAFWDADGSNLDAETLIAFTRDLSLPDSRYDPRVIYDPQEDRFIAAILHGFTRDRSQIILAFSSTNDPTDEWNFYTIDGNPFDQPIFSDYPMLSLTDDELFFTVNAVRDDESWQTGFVETYIWQIDKMDGYNGDSLNRGMWSGIEFDGQPIRNLCPIKSGKEDLDDHVYFVSNRNFAVENDSFFFLKLTGTIDDPDKALDIQLIMSDQKYGVPPNAQQKSGALQTNDARVLDGIIIDGQIQFVGNSVNPDFGNADVFHGFIADVENPFVEGNILGDGTLDFGYPSIAWSGLNDGDFQTIINMAHASKTRNSGYSALIYDGLGEYSPLVTVQEGESFINAFGSPERWGDYSCVQRDYANPGQTWMVNTYGGTGSVNAIAMANVARPEALSGNTDLKNSLSVETFPNPFTDNISVNYVVEKKREISIYLTDGEGRKMADLMNVVPKKPGKYSLSISGRDLLPGTYYIVFEEDGKSPLSRKIIQTAK